VNEARGRSEGLPTRERILLEASNLFARRGYHGTSTREIARAVGVRQPSLFHHFPSKDAILQTLIDSDLDHALPFAEQLAGSPEPAGLRLYRFLVHDVLHLTGSPYNLSGLYTEEVMSDPRFAPWAEKRARFHAAIERIIASGVDSGDFIDVPPRLVREVITGVMVRILTVFRGGRAGERADLADGIASLILRAVLRDPRRLASIREEVLGAEVASRTSEPGDPAGPAPGPAPRGRRSRRTSSPRHRPGSGRDR
jgi:AcrR family transcriptional regulator